LPIPRDRRGHVAIVEAELDAVAPRFWFGLKEFDVEKG
jgi:hypothetical protein